METRRETDVAGHGRRAMDAWRDSPFDVVIVGAGINGAGLARDLALRGIRVLLVDKGDFGSATSSASTKLIHGGLRYLENFDFSLVFESCRERAVLQKIAPHLVKPLPFFIPVYRGDPRPLWMIRAGLLLYDLLALFRNPGRHRIFSAERARRLAPVLQPEGLSGVARYWDCSMDDARLCLENVIAAREAGATVENYVEAVGFLHEGETLSGVRLRDLETGREVEVAARCVVNASGPWLDRVRALEGDGQALLRPTRGTHILVPRIGTCEEALYLTAGSDERLFFVIPWGELSLIGTTDVDFADDPDRVAPTEGDIDYLLEESRRHLRGVTLTRDHVVAAFAGLRPLIAEEHEQASRVSREHRVVVSPGGLISLGGGKYTTYRAVCEEVADLVVARLGLPARRCVTARVPLPGARAAGKRFGRHRHWKLLRRAGILSEEQIEGLLGLYGTRIEELFSLLSDDPGLAEPVCPGSSLLKVQVLHGVQREGARTPGDVLRRRTPLALGAGRGLAELNAVSDMLAQALAAGEDVRARWKQDYRASVKLFEQHSLSGEEH